MDFPGYPYYPYYHYHGVESSFGERQLESNHSSISTSTSKQYDGSENSRGDMDISHRYTYCLKIFNPSKRSKFTMEKFRRAKKFNTPQELRESLVNDYEDLLADKDDFDIGYTKGKGASKVWIKDDEDLLAMYRLHSKDQEIVLWCEGRRDVLGEATDTSDPVASTGRKRKASDVTKPPPSKRQAI